MEQPLTLPPSLPPTHWFLLIFIYLFSLDKNFCFNSLFFSWNVSMKDNENLECFYVHLENLTLFCVYYPSLFSISFNWWWYQEEIKTIYTFHAYKCMSNLMSAFRHLLEIKIQTAWNTTTLKGLLKQDFWEYILKSITGLGSDVSESKCMDVMIMLVSEF